MPTPKYILDGVRGTDYVRAHKEGRGQNASVVVQVWKGKTTPEGDPDGDWEMPGVLGNEACIDQAVLQTDKK